ncbi:MmgE/PrpD family protein [Bordetella petrii]|uniref:MmgE/PrpD family protein n=1 Tax=Bordetella petrii TaxID=94624 RepID=UPI001E3DA7FF|nr:MmgE/PrpD family protein [Bordetella petrii]MCD0504772.1 MmgE/PrpD family protein [Bordetella petrii]
MPSTPEAILVHHLAARRSQPVAVATRERLAQALLDWFTAGWSGIDMPAAATMREVAAQCHPGPGVSPVFGGAAASGMAAAFANAAIAHLREIDDAHRAAMLHPGVVAITPVLALASQQALTQRQATDAIIAGYEVSLRLGEALGTRHAANFHATATAGSVGAAAAAGVALGLAPDQLHHALGIAATQAAGLWQLVDDGAHASKSLHPAMAVRNGLTAAYAARAGLPGARAFATGPRGLYALLAGDGPIEALDSELDGPERINTATIKAWPCCAQLFTPLDAIRDLIDAHGIKPADVQAVDITIFPHALKIAGVDWPANPSETCFSLRYVAATLLLHGQLRIQDMEAPQLGAPALRELAARITVSTDDAFQRAFPRKRPSRVTIALRDGRQFSALRELRRGDPEEPYTWQALQARMRSFAPGMGDAAAGAISDWCAAYADPARDTAPCLPAAPLFGS